VGSPLLPVVLGPRLETTPPSPINISSEAPIFKSIDSTITWPPPPPPDEFPLPPPPPPPTINISTLAKEKISLVGSNPVISLRSVMVKVPLDV
jgi:hypothetical protein